MVDSVADAMHQIKADAAAFENGEAGTNPRVASIDHLEGEIALTLLPALLLFAGAAAGLGLVIYFFINLSDCQDDLINPYTLCERVNSKLHWELAAHAAAVTALVLEELIDGDRLHWVALILALPGLVLRIVWWRSKQLEIDATSVFHPRFAGRLRTRWGLMCFWHGVTLLFGFVQLVLHMVLGLHSNMPHTMRALGDHHVKRAEAMRQLGGIGGMHPMNHMVLGH